MLFVELELLKPCKILLICNDNDENNNKKEKGSCFISLFNPLEVQFQIGHNLFFIKPKY